MPTRLANLGVLAASLIAVSATLAAPTAAAEEARYEGASADASVILFSTKDRMVTGDTDGRVDIFERSRDASVGDEFVTRVVSVGPIGGNQAHDANFAGVSADGARAFFSTREALAPADGDQATDVYMRNLDANTTTLVSQGAAICADSGCGNGPIDASSLARGIAAGGDRVFFATVESLSPLDTDTGSDVYMRAIGSGTTVLVSQGGASCAGSGCGNGIAPATFRQASADGTKVLLTTAEGLVAGEDDGLIDVYQRDLTAGTTTLVSGTGVCPAGLDCNVVYGGASDDAAHVFFESNERLAGGDLDSSADVYEWSGGTVLLSSTGPDGGNGAANATYAGNSADGAALYFHTDERLDQGADDDGVVDVYRRQGSATTLISTGSASADEETPALFKWASPDGSSDAVIFTTAESLGAADEDEAQDVYARAGTTTTLLSSGDPSCAASDCGNGAFDADFARASADGSHVFFVTDEKLVEDEPLQNGDTDANTDVYERFAGQTRLVSTGPINGNGPLDARLHGVSLDGSVAIFVTDERLTTDDDFETEDDVYSRSAGGTLLVSVGNDPDLELGPPPPTLERTNPTSPGSSTTPAIIGQSDPGTEIKVYTTPNCSGEQATDPAGEAAGGSGSELAAPGIAVAVAPGSTTAFYATAEAEGVVSGCAGPLVYTQGEGTTPPPPPPPPPGEEGTGTGTGGGGASGSGAGSGSTPKPPKTHSGGIAYVTPEARITFGPSFKTRRRVVVFRFHDATEQPGTSFTCKVDRRAWRSCGSPQRVKRLKRGRHVFKVKAVNAVGVWQSSPAAHRFKVVN